MLIRKGRKRDRREEISDHRGAPHYTEKIPEENSAKVVGGFYIV